MDSRLDEGRIYEMLLEATHYPTPEEFDILSAWYIRERIARSILKHHGRPRSYFAVQSVASIIRDGFAKMKQDYCIAEEIAEFLKTQPVNRKGQARAA